MAYQLNLLHDDWTSLHVDQQPVEARCVSDVCTLVNTDHYQNDMYTGHLPLTVNAQNSMHTHEVHTAS